jgi:hypothetical protein
MSDFKRGEPVSVHLGGKEKTPKGYEARAAGYNSIGGDWTRVELDGHYFDFPAAWVTEPTDRAANARIAASTRWANEPDRTAATAKARAAMESKWEREADPDGVLDPAERAERAQEARRAFYVRIAHLSAQARRAPKAGAS